MQHPPTSRRTNHQHRVREPGIRRRKRRCLCPRHPRVGRRAVCCPPAGGRYHPGGRPGRRVCRRRHGMTRGQRPRRARRCSRIAPIPAPPGDRVHAFRMPPSLDEMVDQRKYAPRSGWRRAVHRATRGHVNPGDSRKDRAEDSICSPRSGSPSPAISVSRCSQSRAGSERPRRHWDWVRHSRWCVAIG